MSPLRDDTTTVDNFTGSSVITKEELDLAGRNGNSREKSQPQRKTNFPVP